MKTVTCIAPVNIAVIKYWGKKDENLILPINDSLSSTLSTDYMCAKTTIMASPNFKENKFWLNGKEESLTENPRLNNCLKEVRKRANPDLKELLKCNIHICSVNNFPTAAGLASSAAGYACLVTTLSTLYNVKGDISALARVGSGSACRSVYGGWVQWHKGSLPTGEDSIASQVIPASHWPEMCILVLVVNDVKKKCSSTSGMKRSVQTSELIHYRAEKVVPKRITQITEAIKNKNFDTFAKITMQDSNQFHSVCLDTFPPCVYMNDISHGISEMVHAYNTYKGSNMLAYTFDAGANACLYLLESEVPEVIALIEEIFPQTTNASDYYRGHEIPQHTFPELRSKLNLNQYKPGCLKYVIYTKVGDGPKVLTDSKEHLLDKDGFPK